MAKIHILGNCKWTSNFTFFFLSTCIWEKFVVFCVIYKKIIMIFCFKGRPHLQEKGFKHNFNNHFKL